MSTDRSVQLEYINRELGKTGHSAQLFFRFWEDRRFPPLETCSTEELEVRISQFKARYSSSSVHLSDFEEMTLSDRSASEYQVAASTLLPTDLCGVKNLSIRVCKCPVRSPEAVYEGLMSGTSVFFEVKTQPMGWSVKRKFKDFYWLHKMLTLHFPGNHVLPTQVPPISLKEKKKPEGMQEMAKDLTYFCEVLARSEIFRYSQYLRSFLNAEKKALEGIIKNSWAAPVPETVNDYLSPTGRLQCLFTLDLDRYEVPSQYFLRSKEIYKKLNLQLQSVAKAFTAVAEEIAKLQEIEKELEVAQGLMEETPGLKELYTAFNETLQQWATSENDIGNLVLEECSHFYRFQERQSESMKDFLYTRECLLRNYLRDEQVLTEKKEELWQKGNPAKWGLNAANRIDASQLISDKSLAFPCMLYEESQKLQVQKDKYAFYNAQAAAELNRVLRVTGKLESERLIELAKSFDEEMQSISGLWRGFVRKAISCFE